MKIDLVGKTFGRLTVLSRGQNNKHRQATWVCQCNCAEKRIVTVVGCSLKKGETTSCGCFQKEQCSKLLTIDLVGKVFGEWQVLERVGSSPVKYKCRCKCQSEHVVLASNLSSGKTKSCRKCAHSKPNGYAAKMKYYISIKNDARRRGYSFSLPFDRFVELCESPCLYCGAQPNRIQNPGGNSLTGSWKCNGIDRRDNTLGYVDLNCVSACTKCNLMKGKIPYDQFLEHVNKIYKLHRSNGR